MEARTLAEIILKHNCQRSFETRVANGISTLAITQEIASNNGHHYGIDPCQFTDHQGVALTVLQEYDLLSRFTLLEGPTHLEAPKLLSKNEKFDFAFIDGMYTFGYKFIDFFYADQIIKVGGFLVFHDFLLPSVKKIYKFINKQYKDKYQLIMTPELQPSLYRKAKYMAAAFIKGKPYWYDWPNNFCNLLVLQKTSDTECSWNYFENF
ncbi:class I SAM-dependent methyltransferase [Oxynema aestuarii]|jgi:predicted O-methyltransferase YrrM|uniref:Class I SAM-dependent methyltransferase n=1 Tax=Oxynema aestuarii AP17 TaxID=2064643 RepID=A0A6H1U0Y3_9CYAN|nr:class I SAM-dependent methyltransferase [Oxynema aestuarii]QIZ72491.1 class I SAM-dependent methyltransferase [Oxynema aestuarii AP17]